MLNQNFKNTPHVELHPSFIGLADNSFLHGVNFSKMIELNRKRDLNVSCIYKLTFCSGKIYIGQTINLYRRCVTHKNASYEGQVLLKQAQKECEDVGKKTLEVLRICEKHELEYWEKYYINFYNSADSDFGLNLELGGTNGRASKKSLINKKHAAENKREYSQEGLNNIIASRRKLAKPIVQYDLEWNFIREWETTGDFAKSIGFKKAPSIHSGCQKGYTRYGYKWKYK